MRDVNYDLIKKMKLDQSVLGLVAKIHEYRGMQPLFFQEKPEALSKLDARARIDSIRFSNEIEGIRASSSRTRQICNDNAAPKTRDEEEIAGYRDALAIINDNYADMPVIPQNILNIHRVLFSHSHKTGGEFKTRPNVIEESTHDGMRVVFAPIDPHEVPLAITDICREFNRMIDSQDVNPLILIFTFIFDFLCIHPFDDGNGRMSRLLTTLLLYRSGYMVGKYVSLEKIINQSRQTYYEALDKSNPGWETNTGDITPFIRYMLGTIISAYSEMADKLSDTDDSSALEYVQTIISQTMGRFTRKDIEEKAPRLGRTTVAVCLTKLTEAGIIERKGTGKSTYYVRKPQP
ncbi:MAG: Fic family protein [Clostridia bacterium]|nr:Fic family protein [Clostridia bacterium]